MSNLWHDGTDLVLRRALDAAAERQRVAAHNIANVNTPQYKRQEVLFENELKQALRARTGGSLQASHPRHFLAPGRLADLQHRVTIDDNTTMRTDGNNVDIDQEMALLSINQLNYNALTQVLNERYGLFRYILHDGRR